MPSYLYVGDPMAAPVKQPDGTLLPTRRIAVTVATVGKTGNVSLKCEDGRYVNQQPPSAPDKRDSWGVLGYATAVGPWEQWHREGAVVTGFTGDVYVLVDIP